VIVLNGDTNFIIPFWRLREANKIFVFYEESKETIASLEKLIEQWEDKSLLQTNQIKDLTSILDLKNLEINTLNQKIVLKTQEIGLNEDKLKYYKKQNKVLKIALGASILGLIGITIFAVAQ